MSTTDLDRLNNLWDEFFMEIRDGNFKEEMYEHVLAELKKVDTNKLYLEKELVTLIWFIPTYLDQNGKAWVERGLKIDLGKFDEFKIQVESIIMEKLEIP
jgi:hypothetical protein